MAAATAVAAEPTAEALTHIDKRLVAAGALPGRFFLLVSELPSS